MFSHLSRLIQKKAETPSSNSSFATLVSGYIPVFLCGADPCYVSINMIMDFAFLDNAPRVLDTCNFQLVRSSFPSGLVISKFDI